MSPPIDLVHLFERVAVRHAAAAFGTQPEHHALAALIQVTLQRGREALERFDAHGRDAIAERLMFLACDAGLAYKKLLLGAETPSRPELATLLGDLQLLIVELFERVCGEHAAPRAAPILH